MFLKKYCIQIFWIFDLLINYFDYACSKWCAIFKFCLLISFVFISWCCICSCSLHKSVRITVVTKIWLQHHVLEPDLPIYWLSSDQIIIHLNPVFYSDFGWLIIPAVKKIFWWYSILTIYIYNYRNNKSSSIIYCNFSGGTYFSFRVNICCITVLSVCVVVVNLFGSSRVVSEAIFTISFPTRSLITSAVFLEFPF